MSNSPHRSSNLSRSYHPSNAFIFPSQHPATSIEKQLFYQIFADFPQFQFKLRSRFTFHPPRTIIIGDYCNNFPLLCLHELGHAISEHKNYSTHVQLLQMEREAWEQARVLAKTYHLPFDEEFAQSHLDTYRNWLHQKSRCPKCGLNRFQTLDGSYHCPQCDFFL